MIGMFLVSTLRAFPSNSRTLLSASIVLYVLFVNDEVWISSVKKAQLPPIPLLESAASSRMITGVVLATMPPTLKLGIIECNVLKKKMV